MAKYIELKKNIINYIKEKDLKPHDLIPSTKGLENLYNVSTITIRKAIDELVNEGVLYRVHGKGTYVADQEDKYLEIYTVLSNIFPKDFMLDSYSLFPQFIQVLESAMFANKMEMIISSHNYDEKLEKHILQHVLKKDVDGLIFQQSGYKSNIPYYSEAVSKFPNSVFVDTYIPEINSNYVVTNNYKASFEICDKICNTKVKKIYCIIHSEVQGTAVYDRKLGFMDCVKKNNIDYKIFEYAFFNFDDFKQKIYDDFSKENIEEPFGIFVINAVTAHYLYEACQGLFGNLKYSLGTFEKPIDVYNENVTVFWAEQNIQEMTKLVVQILKTNPIQKQHIYVPAIIHKEI